MLDALRRRWRDPDARRNGRRGQRQDGVDIYGKPQHLGGGIAGAQCKNTEEATLTVVKKEIRKADRFKPPLGLLYLVFAAERDARLEESVRLISNERRTGGQFPVEILFFEDVYQELASDSVLVAKHWPGDAWGAQTRTLSNLPRGPNRFFVGRVDFITAMRARFTTTNQVGHTHVQVISGLGGVGKTQTALEYGYRYADQYRATFLIRAESEESIQQSLSEIRDLLKDSTPFDAQDDCGDVRTWLVKQDSWLVILDNLSKPELSQPWIAIGNGHVLITSRNQDWQDIGVVSSAALESFSLSQATGFLLQRTGRTDSSDAEIRAAEALAGELGGLPLALEQACAYMVAKQASFSSYLEALRHKGPRILDHATPKFGNYRSSVGATWLINFGEIAASGSIASLFVLHASAFLNADQIPLELFRNDEEKSSLWEDELLQPLVRLSLIKRDMEQGSFHIHRLVQSSIREAIPREMQAAVVTLIIGKLSRFFPHPIEEADPVSCRRLIPHVLHIAKFISGLHIKTGDMLVLLNQAAVFIIGQHRYRSASELLSLAIASFEPLESASTVVTKMKMNLAACYGHLSRRNEATQLIEQAVAQMQRDKTVEPADMALALNNLALEYKENDPRHERLLRESLELRREHLGVDHPDVAQSLHNMAGLECRRNHCDAAEALCLQAIAIRERNFGAAHPLSANSYEQMAVIFRTRGDHAQAAHWFERALDSLEKSLDPEHPAIARCLYDVARTFKRLGRNLDAIDVLSRAAKIRRTRLEPDDDTLDDTIARLVEFSVEADRVGATRSLLQDILTEREARFGKEDPSVASMVYYLGLVEKANNVVEARRLFHRGLSIVEKIYGNSNPKVARYLNELALLAEREQEFDLAVQLHGRAISIVERTKGKDSSALLDHLNNLALIHMRCGRLEECIRLHERSLSIREANLERNDPRTARCLMNLGVAHGMLGHTEKAEQCYLRAKEIREVALPANAPETISGLHMLGIHYLARRDQERAKPLLAQAIELTKNDFAVNPELLIRFASEQVAMCCRFQMQDLAESILNDVLAFASRMGKHHDLEHRIQEQVEKLIRKEEDG